MEYNFGTEGVISKSNQCFLLTLQNQRQNIKYTLTNRPLFSPYVFTTYLQQLITYLSHCLFNPINTKGSQLSLIQRKTHTYKLERSGNGVGSAPNSERASHERSLWAFRDAIALPKVYSGRVRDHARVEA